MASLCGPRPTLTKNSDNYKRSAETSMIIPNKNSHAIWRGRKEFP